MQPHLPPLKVENLLKEQTFFKLPQSSLNLKVNGTVRAEVVDVLPSGSVLVRMNGQELELRTEIPLQKDTTLLLKVLGVPGSEKAIKLQLLSIENPKEKKLQEKLAALDLNKEFNIALKLAQGSSNLQKTMQQLVQKGLVEQFHALNKEVRQLLSPQSIVSLTQNSFLQQLRFVLKDSSQDLAKLKQLLVKMDIPKEYLSPIEAANTFQDLQKAVLDILHSFVSTTKEPSILQNYLYNAKTPQEFFTRLDQLSSIFVQNIDDPNQLQTAIENSGVLLETKLDSFVKQFMLLQSAIEEVDMQEPKDIVSYLLASKELDSDIKKLFTISDRRSLHNTLELAKKILHAKVQESLDHDLKAIVSKMITEDPHNEKLRLLHQDIQNYQLLSTLTGLFHTYLPIAWEDLKEGAIKIGKKKSYFLCDVDLDFEDIGRVFIRVLQLNRSLKVDFFIENEDFRKIIDQSREELSKELGDFDEVIVTFVTEPEAKNRYTFKNGIEIHI